MSTGDTFQDNVNAIGMHIERLQNQRNELFACLRSVHALLDMEAKHQRSKALADACSSVLRTLENTR